MTLLCYSHFSLFVTLLLDFLSFPWFLQTAFLSVRSYFRRNPIYVTILRENALSVGYKLPEFLSIYNEKEHLSWILKRTSNMSAISSDLENLKSKFHAIASGVLNNFSKRQHRIGPMEFAGTDLWSNLLNACQFWCLFRKTERLLLRLKAGWRTFVIYSLTGMKTNWQFLPYYLKFTRRTGSLMPLIIG